MPSRSTAKRGKRGAFAFVDTWVELFAEHNLLTWATAIAFNVFKALVPLAVLVLAVLGALHERRVWTTQIAPGIHKRLPAATWDAVNYAAQQILSHAGVGLIAFAVLLTVWEMSGSVRAVIGAMNRVYDTDEERPIWLRWALSFALAVAIAICLVGSILLVTLAKHLGGSVQWLVGVGRWFVAIVLVAVAIELLVRFAPTEPREKRWVTLGSSFTVVAWVVASLIFKWWATSVASFRSAGGTFVAILVLTGYLYTSAIVFMVGVEADELVRKDATRGERGLLDRVRAATGG